MHLLYKNKLSPRHLQAFFSCFIGGYLFHLYAFTNTIPNSDGIGRVYDVQNMTVSGRWFLQYASFFHGFTQMPAFIALITLCFLSLSAMIIVELLDINHRYIAGTLGLCFVTFPSLGFTYLYMFTASAYSIAIFLAIFSLWFVHRTKFWYLGVLCLTLSMGIYQAYAAFTIGLSVILVIKKSLSPQETLVSTTKFGVKLLGFLALSGLLYYMILHVILLLTGQELLSYLGMNQGYPFGSIPTLILSCYKQVILFFLRSGTGTSTWILSLLTLGVVPLGLVGVGFLVKPYLKEKNQQWRLVYLFLLCALLPLAIGFVQVISPWSSPTPLMQYPYVLAYVAVFFFLDHATLLCPTHRKSAFVSIILTHFLFISFGGGWLCNLLYTASAQSHRATESYVTRIVTQIEMTEGYQWGMPIVIVGAFPEDRFYSDIPSYALVDHYSVDTHSVLPLNKHIYYYLNQWLNIPVEEPSEEVMISISNHKEFQEMPRYPDYGSVAIIDGTMVVKVGETYLPKSDFELAYEESR